MKAAVFYDKGDVRVEDVREPEICEQYDVKIRVSWCGICGSDMEEYLYGPIVMPVDPHPLTKQKIPLILGHEFCGEVVETGDFVTNVAVGDMVVAHPVVGCGVCKWCRQSTMCLCEDEMACIGLQKDGAFAEYVVVPHANCYKAVGDSNFERMAMIEPTATAYRALKKANLNVGDNLVILGGGTIGLLTLQMAKLAGADKVIVIEISEDRIKLAMELGATKALNPKADNIEEELLKITDGTGIDTVIECVGNAEAPAYACKIVNKGGTVVLIGVSPEFSLIDVTDVVRAEKNILGLHGYDSFDFEKSISLVNSGLINVEALISKKIRLENIIEEGLDVLAQGTGKDVKILVRP